jgi:abortive infection bacteriophage resistance protein
MPAKTRQQIALEYGICTKTFNKWLKNTDIKLPIGLITPYYQELIYEQFGHPNYSAKR